MPEGEYIVPIGKANVAKEGKDVTLISYSIMMKNAFEAAEILAKDGIDVEVIDLRTIVPYDKETILESVKKTHRLVIVHEAVKQGGVGAEIAAFVAEGSYRLSRCTNIKIWSTISPVPFSPVLENAYRVKTEDIVEGIRKMF